MAREMLGAPAPKAPPGEARSACEACGVPAGDGAGEAGGDDEADEAGSNHAPPLFSGSPCRLLTTTGMELLQR